MESVSLSVLFESLFNVPGLFLLASAFVSIVVSNFKSIEEEYQEEEQRAGMTSMFGARIGTWLVSSTIDSRWNNRGRGFGLVVSGGPDEMQQWIDQCEKEYGDKPKDLERSFMKD